MALSITDPATSLIKNYFALVVVLALVAYAVYAGLRERRMNALHETENEPFACRPAAPDWGFAAAVLHGGKLDWAGGGWTNIFGPHAPAISPAAARAARSGRTYVVLQDRRGQAVLAALAARRHAAAWPVVGALAKASSDSALVAMVFAPSRMPGFADFAARVYAAGLPLS